MKLFRSYILVLITPAIFTYFSSIAQDSETGLKSQDQDPPNSDIQRIDDLLDEVLTLYKENLDSAIKYNDEALELAFEANYQKGIGRAYLYFGRIYDRLDQKDSAIFYCELASDHFRLIDDKIGLAKTSHRLGLIYNKRGETNLAEQQYKKAASIYIEIKDSTGLATALGNLGNIAYHKGIFYKSIQYLLESLRISELNGDSVGVAYNSGNLSLLFNELEEYELAIGYSQKSNDIFNILKDSINAALTIANLGYIYFEIKEYDKALGYFQDAEKAQRKLSNLSGLANSLNNIALIYEIRNDGETSLKFAKEAYRIYTDIDEINRKSIVFLTLANAYVLIEEYDSALHMLKTGLRLSSKRDDKTEMAKFYDALHKLYQQQNNYINSAIFLNKYLYLTDTINYNKTDRQILDLHDSYIYEKKENENLFLKTEQQLQDLLLGKIKFQQYFLNMSIIGLSMLAILFGYLLISNKSHGRKMENFNREVEDATEKLEDVNEKLFISQADMSIANENLKDLNSKYETQIQDRSSVIMKSRYVLSNILGVSSDCLYESVQQISHVSEGNVPYGDNEGKLALQKILNILDKSDELFNQLIELRELAKQNVIVEKISCRELMSDIWFDLVKSNRMEVNIPKYKGIKNFFDADYTLTRSLIYYVLEYILIQSHPRLPDITTSFRHTKAGFLIEIFIKGQLQIPFRMKKSLSYLFQQAQDGSKNQIILLMIKIALEKLKGNIDFNSSTIEDSTVSIRLPNPEI